MRSLETMLKLLDEEVHKCTDEEVARQNHENAPSTSKTYWKWFRREIEIADAKALVEAPKCTDGEVAVQNYRIFSSPIGKNIWKIRSNELQYPDVAIEASRCTDFKEAEQNSRVAIYTMGEREIWKDRMFAIIRDRVVKEISQCTFVEFAKQKWKMSLYGSFYEEWHHKWVELADAEAEKEVPKCADAEVALQKSIDAPPDSRAQIEWKALRKELVCEEIRKCTDEKVAKQKCEEAPLGEETKMWEARWIELRYLL